MRNIRPKIALLVFGEGGHSTAFHRLHECLNLEGVMQVQVLEEMAKPLIGIPAYSVPRIMPKHETVRGYLGVIPRLISNIVAFVKLHVKYNVRIVLTTGPGVVLLHAGLLRLIRREVVFVESWCRFRSISRTGRILHWLGATIYVQNEEVLQLLPRLKYCGRLG